MTDTRQESTTGVEKLNKYNRGRRDIYSLKIQEFFNIVIYKYF